MLIEFLSDWSVPNMQMQILFLELYVLFNNLISHQYSIGIFVHLMPEDVQGKNVLDCLVDILVVLPAAKLF